MREMGKRRVKLERAAEPLRVEGVHYDAQIRDVMSSFDIDTADIIEESAFYPWVIDGEIPDDWGIGVVVGASGTGKSTLLRDLGLGVRGRPMRHRWERDRAIASPPHFENAEDATEKLMAVGLNSVPTLAKPYHVLSTGERFRADLARSLSDDALIDEYTSTVSRSVANSASRGLRSWVRRSGTRRIIVATCHYDVVPWLRPDWVINTDAGTYTDNFAEKPEKWWIEFTADAEVPVGAIRCD